MSDSEHVIDMRRAAEPDDLAQWWIETAQADYDAIAPKITEYSAYDLSLVGRVMAEMLGMGDDAELHQELGVFWYLLGKVGRMAGAYREGRRPSDDSWLDASQYALMARRIRQSGGWPSGSK